MPDVRRRNRAESHGSGAWGGDLSPAFTRGQTEAGVKVESARYWRSFKRTGERRDKEKRCLTESRRREGLWIDPASTPHQRRRLKGGKISNESSPDQNDHTRRGPREKRYPSP